MKKKTIFSSFLFLLISLSAQADELKAPVKTDELPFVTYKGFVRLDSYYDTRQTESAREGNILLYPKNIELENGKDKNDNPFFNLTSFFSRAGIEINSLDFLGGKVSGLIEADFFGHLNSTVSNFRLRHSFVKIKWKDVDLLLGQFWDPITTPDVFPNVISVGAGRPFQPFSRNPQIMLTTHFSENNYLKSAITMQRDAFSDDMGNFNQQITGLPAVSLNLENKYDQLFFGVAAFGKAIKPGGLGSENLFSGALLAYAKYNLFNTTFQAKGTFGSDLADHQMVGGFIQSKDKKFYNINTMAFWTDIDQKINDQFSVGLFSGYTANLGTSVNNIQSDKFFGRGQNLIYDFRFTPRLVYNATKYLVFALEPDFSFSKYGNGFNDNQAPKDDVSANLVNNTRISFISTLKF